MPSSASRLACAACLALVAIAGCSSNGDGGTDLGLTFPDLAGADLRGRDLATPPRDLAGVVLDFAGGAQDLAIGAGDLASGPLPDLGGDMANSMVTVQWGTGCWYTYMGQKFQAMPFDLQTQSPIPLEGTLYFDTNCDAKNGTDNLNDTGGTIGSGGWLFWFIHHPDEKMTSAVWWLSNQFSICVDYSVAPDC